jgi:hypothetical protein
MEAPAFRRARDAGSKDPALHFYTNAGPPL